MKTLMLSCMFVIVFASNTAIASDTVIFSKPYYVQTPEQLLQTSVQLRNGQKFVKAMQVSYVAMQFSEEPVASQLEYARVRYAYAMMILDPQELGYYASLFESYGSNVSDNEVEYKSMSGMFSLCQALLGDQNEWHKAVINLSRVCDLKPENINWKKNLFGLWRRSVNYNERKVSSMNFYR